MFYCSQNVLLLLSLLSIFISEGLYRSVGITLSKYNVETGWRNCGVGIMVFLGTLTSHELPRTKQPSVAKNLEYLISCQYSALGNICIAQQPEGILRECSDENVRQWSESCSLYAFHLFFGSCSWIEQSAQRSAQKVECFVGWLQQFQDPVRPEDVLAFLAQCS